MHLGVAVNWSSFHVPRSGRWDARTLRSLDGRRRFACAIFPLPIDYPGGVDGFVEVADEYLQSAGSSSKMALEVRRLETDGYRQYALGLAADDDPRGADEVIAWDDHWVVVRSHEVWTAEQAAPVFEHYIESGGGLPEGLSLRPLELSRLVDEALGGV